ncbi:MAG: radical SAM protein [Candidatus Hydrogenedentota bacterium]
MQIAPPKEQRINIQELLKPQPSPTRAPFPKPARVAFVHTPNPIYADTQNYGAQFMPVWAYTLASHLPENAYDLRLYDTRLEPIETVAEADIFLFSGINQDFGAIVKFQELLKGKYPAAVFLIGGPICWSFQMAGDIDKLGMFDHIFVGDGEDIIAPILECIANGQVFEKVINNKERFKINEARPFFRPFLDSTVRRYYGAVLEVSRGCPFLCEFCDIRILPDNNRAHNKPANIIVSELEHLHSLGVRQILLACDNFIGDLKWAEEVVDAIVAWEERSGARPSLYTWLTINLNKYPTLLTKMRRAGFDMLFIGIESFSSNSLLETAKVQNTASDLTAACREIQAYGFIIVAGLIFGFDSDGDECFDVTLDGLRDSGLISGDPSLLTALPGTPLYRRMKESGRLRQVRYGLGGYKYQTNIKYLMPKDKIIGGYEYFVKKYNDGAYQYGRLKTMFDGFETGKFVPLEATGYGDPKRFATMVLRNPAAMFQLAQRLIRFLKTPGNLIYSIKGFLLMLARRRRIKNAYSYFQFWLFAWTNTVLKYAYLTGKDFDIESVDAGFDMRKVLPEHYEDSADEEIPDAKIAAQLRFTTKQLRNLVASKAGAK